jgi:hypothetical protein
VPASARYWAGKTVSLFKVAGRGHFVTEFPNFFCGAFFSPDFASKIPFLDMEIPLSIFSAANTGTFLRWALCSPVLPPQATVLIPNRHIGNRNRVLKALAPFSNPKLRFPNHRLRMRPSNFPIPKGSRIFKT